MRVFYSARAGTPEEQRTKAEALKRKYREDPEFYAAYVGCADDHPFWYFTRRTAFCSMMRAVRSGKADHIIVETVDDLNLSAWEIARFIKILFQCGLRVTIGDRMLEPGKTGDYYKFRNEIAFAYLEKTYGHLLITCAPVYLLAAEGFGYVFFDNAIPGNVDISMCDRLTFPDLTHMFMNLWFISLPGMPEFDVLNELDMLMLEDIFEASYQPIEEML